MTSVCFNGSLYQVVGDKLKILIALKVREASSYPTNFTLCAIRYFTFCILLTTMDWSMIQNIIDSWISCLAKSKQHEVNLIRFICLTSLSAHVGLHTFFDIYITKMAFTRVGVLMKQKQLCIFKKQVKQTMWLYLLSISQVSFKRPGRRQGFWVNGLILKTERICSSLRMSELLRMVVEYPVTYIHISKCWEQANMPGGTHDIFGRGCTTVKSLYRPFLEFLTKKLDPFRNFCA